MENTKSFKQFDQRVDDLASLGKIKLAFGLKERDQEIEDSLKRSEKYADITLVGPETISSVKGFNLVIDANPEEKIATMLAHDEVDAIIRGTIDDFKTYETYEKLTGEKYTFSPGLMEDPLGRQFFITEASNPDGWDRDERLQRCLNVGAYVREWGIEPKIAVFTGERHETYPRRKHIREGVVGILNKTYEDAEYIVSELTKQGFIAKNWAIDLNPAVEAGYNVICPVNGMVGNQMFRVLLFCGGKVLSATRLGLSRCYEDNSRTEKDLSYHVKWITALVNKKRFNK